MSRSENDQSSSSEPFWIDAHGRDVRTARESNDDVSLDAVEPGGLAGALSLDYGGAEVPQHLLRQA